MNALPIATVNIPVGSVLRDRDGWTLTVVGADGVLLRVVRNGELAVRVVSPSDCWVVKEYVPKPVELRRTLFDVAVEAIDKANNAAPSLKSDTDFIKKIRAESKARKKARHLANKARRAEENRQNAGKGGAGSSQNKDNKNKKGKGKKK